MQALYRPFTGRNRHAAKATTMKSILIKDTTVDERMEIVKSSLAFGDGECEGVDMDDMYDDYIFGRKELAEIHSAFSQRYAGAVKADNREMSASKCMM